MSAPAQLAAHSQPVLHLHQPQLRSRLCSAVFLLRLADQLVPGLTAGLDLLLMFDKRPVCQVSHQMAEAVQQLQTDDRVNSSPDCLQHTSAVAPYVWIVIVTAVRTAAALQTEKQDEFAAD